MPIKTEEVETRKDWDIVQEDVGKRRLERLKVLDGWMYQVTIFDSGKPISCALEFVKDRIGGN